MAWNQYIDTLKSYYPDGIAACGIFGHNGSTWAQSGLDTAQAQYTELTTINGLFDDPSAGYANGVTLNGQRNAFLRVQDKQLLIKSKGEGKEPGCIQKTGQALVVAIGTSTAQAGMLNTAVARLADYLEQQGY
jgi:hypothetical protein